MNLRQYLKPSYWKAGILAFIAMMFTDLIATVMVVQEAHYNAPLAGVFDVVGYLTGLVCTILAVGDVLKTGWKNPKSHVVIFCVSIANFVGTYLGVELSKVVH